MPSPFLRADPGGMIEEWDYVKNILSCIVCPAGLHCPLGSNRFYLMSAEGTEDLTLPFVKKGFNSNLPG